MMEKLIVELERGPIFDDRLPASIFEAGSLELPILAKR